VELTNTFTVDLPVADAWRFLTDLERVAPCLPGAALLSVDGDDYRGEVKIKFGPISAAYTGTARFIERDDASHRAVIRAEGRDTGGQGNAAATITATLTEQGRATLVEVRTQLDLSGRVAQFGRGVISDISNKLLGQFTRRLEAAVAQSATETEGTTGLHAAGTTGSRVSAPGASDGAHPAGQGRTPAADDVEPLDVMAGMGGVLVRRALPVAGAVAVAAGLIVALVAVTRRRTPPRVTAGTGGFPTLVINLTAAAPLLPPVRVHGQEDVRR
jgi:carbon monoxide dehydrogenase subunit G